jgi:tetratricopeptide (TPR) repeat protein
MRQYIPLVTRICTVLLAGIIAVTASSISIAQESGGSQERETKRTPTMSEAVYKKLLEAQEAIDAKDYEGGLMVLRELEASDRLSSYEKSQVFNFFAYTYFTLERYQDALNYYKKIVAEPDNTEGLLLNTLYTMAQLYFVIEDQPQCLYVEGAGTLPARRVPSGPGSPAQGASPRGGTG